MRAIEQVLSTTNDVSVDFFDRYNRIAMRVQRSIGGLKIARVFVGHPVHGPDRSEPLWSVAGEATTAGRVYEAVVAHNASLGGGR